MQRKYLHRRGKTILKPKQLASYAGCTWYSGRTSMNGINLTAFGEHPESNMGQPLYSPH
ncbi:hypothetical protein SAMN05216316_0039 [Nitrosovibrio sp. Nv6]|nr:hypothetical protein SAMN05216316_0039 [Nitrosovibrio sp. Nv6]